MRWKPRSPGKTWQEVPLVNDNKVREFGIAFLDENVGPGMRGFATGKSKKVFEAISKLTYVQDGEAATARRAAIPSRAAKRFERAHRFSSSDWIL